MRHDGFVYELVQAFVIFLAGGFIYGLMEIVYSGSTHPAMFVMGGLSLLWVGGGRRYLRHSPPLWLHMIIGGVFITTAEFICGLVYNVWLGLRIWDYTRFRINIMGQICPAFFFLWIALSLPAVIIESALRSAFSDEI